MYDRRPASRVTLGTPTAAAFTPPLLSVVLRGSCQMAIFTPLARAKGPFATDDISWMPETTSSETGHGPACLNGCSEKADRQCLVSAPYASRAAAWNERGGKPWFKRQQQCPSARASAFSRSTSLAVSQCSESSSLTACGASERRP